MVKLILTDIDGTLITTDRRVTDETRRTICRAVESGVLLAVATGRYKDGAQSVIEQLHIPINAVAYDNGSHIDIDGKLVYDGSMKPDELKGILAVADTLPCSAYLYTGPHWYSSDRNEWYDFVDDFYPGRGIVRNLYDVIDDGLAGPAKIVIRARGEVMQEVQDCMEKRFPGCSFFLSHGCILEVTKKGVNKGSALRFIASHYGFDISETMALGDYNNDADMIKAAGIGVAVGNAVDELKHCADFVAPTNDENGVSFAIRKFVFGEN